MSLPPRGTGLVIGTARVERGLGTPLTEAERLRRHLQGSASVSTALIIAALAAASGAIMIALGLRGRG